MQNYKLQTLIFSSQISVSPRKLLFYKTLPIFVNPLCDKTLILIGLLKKNKEKYKTANTSQDDIPNEY